MTEWHYQEWRMTYDRAAPWTTRDRGQAMRCAKGGWDVEQRTVTCTSSDWLPLADVEGEPQP